MFTRRVLLAPGLGLALSLILAPVPSSAAPDRQVLLVVASELSYQQALGHPLLSELASAGGFGLITTSGRTGAASTTAVNLGAGASAGINRFSGATLTGPGRGRLDGQAKTSVTAAR